MSRTISEGLSFTFLDIHIFEDRKIRKLCRLCDENAPLVYIGMLCAIGKERYYIEWNEDTVLDVADMLHKEESYIEEAVAACLEAGLFSKEMYEKYHILTSHGIQKQYNFVKASSGSKCRVNKYSLLDSSEEKPIPSEEKDIPSQFMPSDSDSEGINSQGMPHRKEENSRVDKRKGNKNNSYSSFPKEKEQEEEFIVSEFFFRGYANPQEEYRKFIAYNNRPGAIGWDKLSRGEKESALQLWKQESNEKCGRTQAFLSMWRTFYNMLIQCRAPNGVRMAALCNELAIEVNNSTAILTVPSDLHLYIEMGVSSKGVHIIELARPILWPYINSLGCNQLNYKHCDT